ncbi:unnamed protein product, partial [Mesorhabditis belari]|uniref:Uncharacterized protein n=1 Tax=Mesorhabditis belari TaxID=2138241 RepID=A0AAF3J4S5_9BILA
MPYVTVCSVQMHPRGAIVHGDKLMYRVTVEDPAKELLFNRDRTIDASMTALGEICPKKGELKLGEFEHWESDKVSPIEFLNRAEKKGFRVVSMSTTSQGMVTKWTLWRTI